MARVRRDVEQLAELLDAGVASGEAHGELANLLVLASSVREHVDLPAPSPAFRAALRSELLMTPPVAPTAIPSGLGDRVRQFVEQRAPELAQSGRAIAATAAGAALLASGGVVAVSQQALPGDLLYGIKGTTEDIRLGFAQGETERGRLHLAFAEERLTEVEDGVERLTNDLLKDTLGRLDDEVTTAAEALLDVFAETADATVLNDLSAFTGNASERLARLTERLPSEVVPLAEDSIELLRRVDLEVAVAKGERAVVESCEQCGAPTNPFDGGSFIITRPGDGPAVPVTECDCTGPAPAPKPSPEPSPPSTVDPPATEPEPEPTEEPTEEPTVQVPQLPGPLDPVGDMLEDQVNDLLDLLPVNPVEELPEPIRTPLEEGLDELDEGVGEVSKAIDDILP